jgi:prepilin-type processing-associated H-X9-DG protein
MPLDALTFAAAGPPFDPDLVPQTVVLVRDRGRLRLTWRNGEETEVSAERMRAACRCAWCVRARRDGTFPTAFDGAAIEQVMPIGDYAINVAFADGHARGIFPWTFLHALAADDATATDIGASADRGVIDHKGLPS